MTTRIQVRRGTASDWTSANPTLTAGEIGFETDTGKFKIGTGSTAWTSLVYASVRPGDLDELAQDAVNAAIVAGVGLDKTYDDNANTITLDIDSTVTTNSGTQTLSNKTLTSPIVDGLGIIFEGAVADSYETTLSVTEPTDDRTITIPDATGTVILDTTIAEHAQDAVGNAVGNGLDYDDNTGAISVDPSEFALSAVGAPTTDVSMATYKITNLGTPSSSTDAATKGYVDGVAEGLHIHEAARAYVSSNIDLSTDLEAGDTIDGLTLVAGDRVLVNGQSTQSQNGIYVVQASGAAVRATDFDTAAEVDSGDFIFVSSGTIYASTGWVQTLKPATIGTDPISFTQFSGAGTYAAGTGLTLAGNTFSINTATTVDVSTAQTLTNKTLTSPVISSITNTGTISLPTSTDTLIGRATTDTLTNKTISGANNTLTVRLANDVTGTLPVANGGTGVTTSTGSGSVVLSTSPTLTTPNIGVATGTSFNSITGLSSTNPSAGGTAAVGTSTAAARADHVHPVSALTIGTGLSGTSYNGSSAVTIAIDSTVATLTGTQTLTNKTVSLANNTVSGTLAQFNTAVTDADLASLAGAETLTNKTIALGSNTVSGTLAQFNTAVTDADLASLAGIETLTNKTLGQTSSTTINSNSASTVDSIALASFTTAQYVLSLKQGTKIRSSVVVMQTDGTTVDITEFGILETGGTLSAVSITGVASGGNALLRVTVTDAASSNVTARIQRVVL